LSSSPSRSSLQNSVPSPSLAPVFSRPFSRQRRPLRKGQCPLGYHAGAEQQPECLQEKAHDRSRRLKVRPRGNAAGTYTPFQNDRAVHRPRSSHCQNSGTVAEGRQPPRTPGPSVEYWGWSRSNPLVDVRTASQLGFQAHARDPSLLAYRDFHQLRTLHASQRNC